MRCRWNGIYATLAKFKLVMIAMQEVAHYLQIEALKQLAQHKDAFARSAYNRYYYACFLALRDAFAKMNSQWSRTPHKTYPQILNGTISKELKKGRMTALKNG